MGIGDDDGTTMDVGKASDATNEDEYVAVLWIPDPTERRGWRDMWISKKKDKPSGKMGFSRG